MSFFLQALSSKWVQSFSVSVTDDLLGEMYFNASHPPRNISFVAREDEFLTMSPYLIFQHTCNGVSAFVVNVYSWLKKDFMGS